MFTGKAEFAINGGDDSFVVEYQRPTGTEYAQHTARLQTLKGGDVAEMLLAHLDYVSGRVLKIEHNKTAIPAIPTGPAQRDFLDSFGFYFILELSSQIYGSAKPGDSMAGK